MSSGLNPDAPEFYPDLTSVTQGAYKTINRTIRSSNQMPLGASYDLFKTFTDFNTVKCHLSENVFVQSNHILGKELPSVKLKRHDNEHNLEKLVDANDSVLDRVNTHLDTLSGANRPSEAFISGVHPAAWNRPVRPVRPVIATIKVGSKTLIGAKNIVRPQLLFTEPVDNSDSLWVPRISDKPNNIKPLALNILYNANGEAVGYEHPYKVELDLYHPTTEQLALEEEPPAPPPLERTPLTMVASEAEVDALVAHLATQPQMAVDLEHHSYRTYLGITCLIQITTEEGGDFIVDALAARDYLHKLNQVFTDPKKLKVFHGAENDILWLQRDFGVYVVGLFDTHRAARALALPALSLKALLLHYCGVSADKKFQLADWRIRPLPEELVAYARCDTHYLLYVWRRMRRELLLRARGPSLLMAVAEAGRQICALTYKKHTVDEDSHLSIYSRSRKAFNTQQMAALKLLYKWRDTHARELDESIAYLLPNHMLLALAEALPREVQGVNALCSPMPPFVKHHLLTIHRMLLSCRELPLEPQLYQTAASLRAQPPPAPAAHALHDLAHVPQPSEEAQPIDLEQAAQLLSERAACAPDVRAFEPPPDAHAHAHGHASAAATATATGVVSDLNVDAKLFIPPYDRYRKYRSLAQIEEIKEFKEKEAKIAAISKGNELIKAEVLHKLQRARKAAAADPASAAAGDAPPAPDKKAQRKRKISDKERKEPPPSEARQRRDRAPQAAPAAPAAPAAHAQPPSPVPGPSARKDVDYKDLDYKKFCEDIEKARKQPKKKFRKHK